MPKIPTTLERVFFCMLALALLSACTPTVNVVTKPAAEAEITIKAATEINPNAGGRASPLVIRIYQLGAAGAFNNSQFFPLFENEAAALGRDLLNREALILKPGETQSLSLPLDKETRFIGLMGAFSNIEAAKWKAIKAVEQEGKIELGVTVEKLSIAFE